jgi:ABC-type sulfate/molybdate transport systems ATPase subunit
MACADWLLMDEPLAHVDPVRKPGFWHSVHEIARAAGTQLVFSCHEPEFILRHAQQVVCLHQGQLLWTGSVLELFENPPSAELGRFLGPLNWWTPAEASALSTHSHSTGSQPIPPQTCLRPHQIQLQPHPSADLTVLQSRCCGLYHETQLQARSGQTLGVLHTAQSPLSPGSTVAAGIQGAA